MLGVLTSLALLAVAPAALGFTSTVVMSDSMAPGLRAGDVVVVRPIAAAEARIGEVVLADDPDFPGRLRLHRLVGHRGDDLVLRGDANAQPDGAAVTPRAVRGVGFLRVPWIGAPLLWLRTGRAPLAVAAALATALLGVAIALLEPADRRAGALAVAARWAFRRLRPAGRIAAGTALLAAALTWAAAATSSSWSVFTAAAPSPANTLAAGSWVCPAVPSPSSGVKPDVWYSFMPASGTAEPNANGGSDTTTYGATLSSTGLRVPGTCQQNASPSVRFSGSSGESVVVAGPTTASQTGTSTLWFSPTSTSGVLADIGTRSGSSASGSDRQLYFTASGALSYAMRDGSSVTTCAVPATVTTNAWHFVAVTVASGSPKTFTVTYYDSFGATAPATCSGTVSSSSTFAAYPRIGDDATIASDASTGHYAGGVDEVGLWQTVLSSAQVLAVKNDGH